MTESWKVWINLQNAPDPKLIGCPRDVPIHRCQSAVTVNRVYGGNCLGGLNSYGSVSWKAASRGFPQECSTLAMITVTDFIPL